MRKWLKSIDWGAIVGSALVLVFLLAVFEPLARLAPSEGRFAVAEWIDRNHDDIAAVSTFVIAAFTITLWWATRGELRQLKESIALARAEFISTHRPKLRIQHIVITHAVPPGLRPLNLIEEGQPIVGHLTIVNVGETAARIVESHCRVFWTNTGSLPMAPPYEKERANNFAAVGTILGAGEPREFDFCSIENMGSDAADYRSLTQQYHIYVMGRVKYADNAEVVRQTTFCRLYKVVDGERLPRFHIVEDPDYERED